MQLQLLADPFVVCKLSALPSLTEKSSFFFLAKTDQEISLVCAKKDTPDETLCVEGEWRAFRFVGVLDFSLIGILARITSLLAEKKISVFAVSTFDTDYILVKKGTLQDAIHCLQSAGYSFDSTEA